MLLTILGGAGVFGGGSYKIMYSSYYTSNWDSPYYPYTFELKTDGGWYQASEYSDMEYQYVSGKHSSTLVLNLRCVKSCNSDPK